MEFQAGDLLMKSCLSGSKTAKLLWLLAGVLISVSTAWAAVPGRVVAWGDNSSGQTAVPTNIGHVIAIAAGGFHSLAVRTNGTVVAWGQNGQGQTNVPPGLSNVIAVSAGGYFSVALRSDGTVIAWGANELGQTNIPPGLANVVAISSGWNVSLALKADGTVVGWGQNNNGQASPPPTVVNVRAIASTEAHGIALLTNGTVVGWGEPTPIPPGLAGITAIAANGYHDLALKSDGTVVAWGENSFGQSTVPTNLAGVAVVAAGYSHSLAAKSDGTVVAWGWNGFGQTTVPTNLSGVVVALAGGYFHSLAISATDTTPPSVVSVAPASNATIHALSQITVAFTEAVTNVDASDLLINGLAAANVTALAPHQFAFQFPQPPTGTVGVAWASGHNITDLAGNAFTGGSWSYNLETNVPLIGVMITEFVAANGGSFLDEDGDSSDWIEIYNPGPDPVLLEDWSLTDDPANLGKWRFPARSLAANSYLVVFASGKERYSLSTPLHTNFRLDADGGYLALVRPDGTIASEFAPAFPAQRTDVSYGTARETVSPALLAAGAFAKVFVPSNGTLGLAWTGGAPFNDSAWLSTTTGVGFDQGGGIGNSVAPLGCWTFDDNSVPTQARDTSGNNHHGTVLGGAAFTASGGGRSGSLGDRAMNFGPCTNGAYIDVVDASTGWFDSATARNQCTFALWIFGHPNAPCQNSAFHLTQGINGDHPWYVANAHLPWEDGVIYWDTGGYASSQRVSIPAGDPSGWKGQWNHYAFVKDGNSKQIWRNGVKILDQLNSDPLHQARSFYIGSGPSGIWSYGGMLDDFAVWDVALSQAQIQALAAGAGPLELDTYGPLLGGDIGPLMRNRNASAFVRIPLVLGAVDFDTLLLRMRYDDGFVCWINGVEVARRNAPEALVWNSGATTNRTKNQARSVEEINVSAAISALREGTNILAFQALNSSAADAELLLLPELVAVRSSGRLYFPTPTPGAANGLGIAGFVTDTKFSTDRGFYNSATNVLITSTTPGAYIVYTRDGTVPTPSNGTRIDALAANMAPTATVAVATTTLLRAAAFKDGWQPTGVDTHTYIFLGHVGTQIRPGWLPATWPGGSAADFAMDSRIVNNPLPGYTVPEALVSIPTLSIVTPSNGLFSSGSGIYPNSLSTGPSWEKPASAELMYADSRTGFQIDCGIRIHGGSSRDKSFTPKHSFSLLFQEAFGASKLEFNLFTNSPVRKFDQLVLRACSTDSWPVQDGPNLAGEPWPRWTRDEASYMRDQWMRDAQRDMGSSSARGIYVHLYLDGLYWGLYNLTERPDDSFAEEHFGGQKQEFDVISDVSDLHAGTWTAWNEMFSFAQAGLSTDAAVQRIQGNNPDGTRNLAYPRYLDLTNLIDYMILHIASGADDWPDHNWWAVRRQGTNSEGFRFFVWDQEIANNSLQRTRISHSPFPLFAEASTFNSPAYLYSRLRANTEFRVAFGDRVQRHLFNRGQLSVSTNIMRWQKLHDEIDKAVVAESARWGDASRATLPYKREVEWVSNQTWMVNTYFPSNLAIAATRFRNAGLYPSLGTPLFSQFGGNVPTNFQLNITHTNVGGIIFYTVDGSDPRGPGGVFGNTAQFYSQPVPITSPTLVRARVNNGANWSALVEAQFFTPQDLSKLHVSEIMYNPPMFGTNDGDEVEFLELKNSGTNVLDLSGLSFSKGIQFAFSNETQLGSGQFFVLARNAALFAAKYPGAPLNGIYSGKLDNAGETVTLSGASGTIVSVPYDNDPPWTGEADNTGLSLQRMNFTSAATNPFIWIAAAPTPGADLAFDLRDNDGDGMPNGWESFHNLNPNLADASADPDGDGLTNYQEYLAGTRPDDGSEYLKLEGPIPTSFALGQTMVLGFSARSNKTYTILYRNSATEGGWTNLVHISAVSTNRHLRITNGLPAGLNSRFYQVRTPRLP
jgi:hypothetical protein